MSTIGGWKGVGFTDANSTQARTLGGLFFWDVARQHLNTAFDAMREDLNAELAHDDFARAVAHTELARIWRAAALTLVELRLPKRRRKPGGTWSRAYTLNPGKKKTKRDSRVFKVKKVRSKGNKDAAGRVRSKNVGTYQLRQLNVYRSGKRGRPRMYWKLANTREEKLKQARVRAARSYANRSYARRSASGTVKPIRHWLPKEKREALRAVRAKEKQVRREMRLEMKGAKIGRKVLRWIGGKLGASASVVKEDKRSNHHPEYDYARPRLRLRRSTKAAARGAKRFPNTEKKRVASRVLRTVTKARQEFLSRGRKIKRMAKLRAGLKRWRAEFEAEFRRRMGYSAKAWTGQRKRRNSKGSKKHGAKTL
jgi:hypothetical protein